MGKILCVFSTVISSLLFLLFLLDISAGIPFKKANVLFDVIFIICMLGILALSILSLLKNKWSCRKSARILKKRWWNKKEFLRKCDCDQETAAARRVIVRTCTCTSRSTTMTHAKIDLPGKKVRRNSMHHFNISRLITSPFLPNKVSKISQEVSTYWVISISSLVSFPRF